MTELMRLMRYKLKVHESKGHWRDEDYWRMMKRLDDERDELMDALATYQDEPTLDNWKKVEYECADVGNFLMMIIDIGRTNLHPELRNG